MSNPDSSSPTPPRGSNPPEKTAPRPALPQPKPLHGPRPPDAEGAIGSGSATGFVSMLAKRQFDADVLSATLADEAARRERLAMAREVTPPGPATPPPAAPLASPTAALAALPRWYRLAHPVALVLTAMLLLIGVWAIGALLYMHFVIPSAPHQVHYPLIAWRWDAAPAGSYTRASRAMAWAMLLCLPLAALLVALANQLRERAAPRK